jgi:hypothetical protein
MRVEKMKSFLTILINKPMTGCMMPDDQPEWRKGKLRSGFRIPDDGWRICGPKIGNGDWMRM